MKTCPTSEPENTACTWCGRSVPWNQPSVVTEHDDGHRTYEHPKCSRLASAGYPSPSRMLGSVAAWARGTLTVGQARALWDHYDEVAWEDDPEMGALLTAWDIPGL